jgi:hypothetical protein
MGSSRDHLQRCIGILLLIVLVSTLIVITVLLFIVGLLGRLLVSNFRPEFFTVDSDGTSRVDTHGRHDTM